MPTITPRWCRRTGWLILCAALAGCAEKPPPPPPAPQPHVFASDLAGAGKRCNVPAPSLADGKETLVTMQLGNDGGWCALTVRQDGKPYAAGLLTQAPEHGTVFIHPVGDGTRIDYTPDHGFTGTDAFSVKLIPGDPVIGAKVTVTP